MIQYLLALAGIHHAIEALPESVTLGPGIVFSVNTDHRDIVQYDATSRAMPRQGRRFWRCDQSDSIRVIAFNSKSHCMLAVLSGRDIVVNNSYALAKIPLKGHVLPTIRIRGDLPRDIPSKVTKAEWQLVRLKDEAWLLSLSCQTSPSPESSRRLNWILYPSNGRTSRVVLPKTMLGRIGVIDGRAFAFELASNREQDKLLLRELKFRSGRVQFDALQYSMPFDASGHKPFAIVDSIGGPYVASYGSQQLQIIRLLPNGQQSAIVKSTRWVMGGEVLYRSTLPMMVDRGRCLFFDGNQITALDSH